MNHYMHKSIKQTGVITRMNQTDMNHFTHESDRHESLHA